MVTALRYYWITARGYRLRPWASPYLRWRLETFFGGDMRSLGPVTILPLDVARTVAIRMFPRVDRRALACPKRRTPVTAICGGCIIH